MCYLLLNAACLAATRNPTPSDFYVEEKNFQSLIFHPNIPCVALLCAGECMSGPEV